MTNERKTIFLTVGPKLPLECPLAPAPSASVQARALHRACLIVGGLDRLAKVLESTPAQVQAWIRDEAEIPEFVFRQAVEIMLLYGAKPGLPT